MLPLLADFAVFCTSSSASTLVTTRAGTNMRRDNGGVIDLLYEGRAPHAFAGTVKKVTLDLMPAHNEADKALHEHEQAQGIGAEAAG